ncbi:MAG TPA: PorV/PorQ family protein [Rubricoccaceae bacterium]|nr:PorV/PorQ family protein [Rubricoccaceae bacterium]
MNKLLFPAVLLWAALAAPGARAQDDDSGAQTGTASAEFLNIPVGARATAMGGAFSATANDATAMYWNPAGMTRLEGRTATFEYATWLVGIDFNFAAVAMPTALGTVGVGVTAVNVPEMDVVEEVNGDQMPTGETFDAGSYAVTLSYARALTDRFSLGANVKLLREQIWNSSANGVAFDVGTLFTTPFRGVRLGASISNFGTKMHMTGPDLNIPFDPDAGQNGNNGNVPARISTDEFDLPLTMRVGVATELFQSGATRLSVAVDALSPSASDQFVNLGAELGLLGGLVQFRGGYQELFMDGSPRSFTLGGGLRYAFGRLNVSADYAYEAFDYFDGVNRFSFALGF